MSTLMKMWNPVVMPLIGGFNVGMAVYTISGNIQGAVHAGSAVAVVFMGLCLTILIAKRDY